MREEYVRQLYLDCDGVLADFDTGAEAILGMHPRIYEDKYGMDKFWGTLKAHRDFYGSLPPLPDAMELYGAVAHLNPIILTGCPIGNWAAPQKLAWRDKYFPGVPMITPLSKDKRLHGKSGDILVDDYLKYRHLWEEMGGIFIHHKNAKKSIEEIARILQGDSTR